LLKAKEFPVELDARPLRRIDMIRSLWTGATGMTGQQFHIDTISHNLANVNTNGYKKERADFEDLIYQNLRISGTPATNASVVPTGIEIGHGVKVAATQKMYGQGSLKQTENPFDLALVGEGFLRVKMYDGSIAYTRDGTLKIDNNGQLVNSNGFLVDPPITIPEGFLRGDLTISDEGLVTVKMPGNDTPIEVGQLTLTRFINPAGLKSIGENLMKETVASGLPIDGNPGVDGMAQVKQFMVEASNVNVVDEMVDMIVAQRAYEFNSKSVQTSDTLLGIAANLKRS
jgi:flagellar basal-body rod protein FlgG